MDDLETRMGGPRDAFPETAWSLIVSLADRDSPERRAKLNELLQDYWRPIYKFIRASWGKSIEDAKDLTQEFFCTILDGKLFAHYDRDKGRFRSFLKGALRNFLAKAHRDSRALKRGGGRTAISLNVEEVENESFLAETRELSPEEIFDRQWAREVTARSISKLRKSLAKEEKAVYFQVYQRYALNPEDATTYESIAKELGLKVRDVENYLRYARTRLNEFMLENVADYVASREELLEEMEDLLSD